MKSSSSPYNLESTDSYNNFVKLAIINQDRVSQVNITKSKL